MRNKNRKNMQAQLQLGRNPKLDAVFDRHRLAFAAYTLRRDVNGVYYAQDSSFLHVLAVNELKSISPHWNCSPLEVEQIKNKLAEVFKDV